jgi:uncharacterized protein (DUF58 family)
VSKTLAGMVVLIFLSAYMFQNTLMALSGAIILLYLAYRRMEFHSLTRRIGLEVERKVLEDVVHKDSLSAVRLKVSARETVGVRIVEKLHRTFIPGSGGSVMDGTVHPDRPLSMVYSMIPRERGYFRFPPLRITLKESRGLFESDLIVPVQTEVFVRASKKEIAMARLMSRRKQFEITGPAHQRHTRTYRADFKSVREYIPGDRFRDIDWKAMSRLTRMMTKEFEQETNLPTMIMVDTSLSMREVVRQRSKLDHSIALGLQIAVVMNSNGHPVGLMTFDENKVETHLSPGKCELDDIVLSLFRLPNPVETGAYPGIPRSSPTEKVDGENEFLSAVGPFLVKGKRSSFSRDRTTGVFEAMRNLEMSEETGMLIIVISDLETNRPSFLKSMRMALRKKHRVVMVSPFSWPYHLDEIDISPELLEKMYIDNQEKQTLIRSLRAGGIKVIDIGSRERGDKVISGIRRMSQ